MDFKTSDSLNLHDDGMMMDQSDDSNYSGTLIIESMSREQIIVCRKLRIVVI